MSRGAVAKWESDKGISDADIISCHPEKILTNSEKLVDFAVLRFTPLPDICNLINSLKDVEDGTAFFLIDDGGRHHLVYINREFVETSEFPGPLPTKRFRVGDYQLTPGRVCRPNCKERCMNPKDATA